MFKGSGVALITPFKNGEVNYKKLKQLINWHISKKTDALIICGTTGEAATLSKDEKKVVLKLAVDIADGRIPVIAGTGCNDTKETVEMSQYAEHVGADGLLVVTPYYNKTTQKGLIIHYRTIADSVGIPIILYNVPSRTGLNLLPSTVYELSKHSRIIGIKEASGDISQVAEIASLYNDNFYIYSGNDDQIIPVLSLGGSGVISVMANILPYETKKIVDDYLSGDKSLAKKRQLKYIKLIKSLFIETNPIPIKTAMNELSMDVGCVRLPLVPIEQEHKEILMKEIKALEIKMEDFDD